MTCKSRNNHLNSGFQRENIVVEDYSTWCVGDSRKIKLHIRDDAWFPFSSGERLQAR